MRVATSEHQKEVIFEAVLPSDVYLQCVSKVGADISLQKVVTFVFICNTFCLGLGGRESAHFACGSAVS